MTGPQLVGFGVLLAVGVMLALVGAVGLFKLQASEDQVGFKLPLGLGEIHTKGGAVGIIAIGSALLIFATYLAFSTADSNLSAATTTTEAESAPTTEGDEPTTTRGTSATTSTAPPDEAGCTATFTNPVASIRVDPDPLAQEVRRIPEGTYPVLETTTAAFAGRELLYLRLEVEGDQGWIQYDTILVASVSDECDF